MAINPQKLLPGSTAFTASTKAASSPNARKKDFKSNVTNIKSFSIGIDKYLDRKFTTDKKNFTDTKRADKKEKALKKEKTIESRKKQNNFLNKILSFKSGLGIRDSITNFLLFTGIGRLIKLLETPEGKKFIENALKFTGIVTQFFEDIFVPTVRGIIDFIDLGYEKYDEVKKIAKDLIPDEYEKYFDDFDKKFNEFVNTAIIAGLLFGPSAFKLLRKLRKPPVVTPRLRPRPTTTSSSASSAAAASTSSSQFGRTTQGFRDPSRYRSPGQARARGFKLEQARRTAPGPNVRGPNLFRQLGAQLETGTLFKRGSGLQKFLLKVLKTKAGLKAMGRIIRPIVRPIPLVGGLIDFALNYFLFKEPIGRAAFKATGAILGAGLLGGLLSVVPGVGTFIGAVAGGGIGDKLGGWLYDSIFGAADKKKAAEEKAASQQGRNISDIEQKALDILAKYESGRYGYEAVNQYGDKEGRGNFYQFPDGSKTFVGSFTDMPMHGGKSLADLTIGEIKALQFDNGSMSMREWADAGKLHAVGRYQFIGNTLPGVAQRAGIPDTAKFTKKVQDLMALQLMKERGISPWVGPSDKATPAERALVEEARASIPDSAGKFTAGGYLTKDKISLLNSMASYDELEVEVIIQPIIERKIITKKSPMMSFSGSASSPTRQLYNLYQN